jgi:hypothetical protein
MTSSTQQHAVSRFGDLRVGLLDMPKVAWAFLLFLDPREIARVRSVCRRLRDLASADTLWMSVASVLLLRRLLPRQPPTNVLQYLVGSAMAGQTLRGTYTFEGRTTVKSATMVITRAKLGFARPVARGRLNIEFVRSSGEPDNCVFSMAYDLGTKKFHIVTRRRGLRGMVEGPRLSMIVAPHKRPWLDEEPRHFEKTRGGLRLILTVDSPGTWAGLFGTDVNDLFMVARRAPELAVDAE